MTASISRLNPSSLADSTRLGYSQISIVEPGRVAYVSGQVASQRNDQPIPTDLTEQTRIVVRNLQSALDAIGARTEDVVLIRIFVVDLNDETLARSFPVVLDFLKGAQPCVTGIGVAALAGAELKIEVEMIVRVPG
jgi:enamine deaminase RidA (YjgF/YER057c/UK114 family)